MKLPFSLPYCAAAWWVISCSLFGAELSSWPTWRGAGGTGVAPGATPPTTWSDQQNVRWKAKIPGYGFSTPIIWQDRIFLLTAIETAEVAAGATAAPAPVPSAPPPGGGKGGKGGRGPGGFGGGMKPTKIHEFSVVALDRKTGAVVWQKVARREVPHEGKHATNSFASASPVTDGERLYASFGSRGIYCYDLQGKLLWEKDLGDMQTRNGFGEGASPSLAGNHLIVPWDHEGGSFVVALDKKTGAEVWRKSRDERSSWSTPLVVDVGGKLQAIIPATNLTRSYDAATGELMWEARGLTPNVIPTAVTGHGMVFVTSGFQGSSIQAIKLTARGDVSDSANILWNQRKSTPYVPSPVLSGDRIFFSKSNDAYLSCVNALTGEFQFQDQPIEGMRGIYASPVVANGLLYVVGRDGMVAVLKDAAKFEIVAKNKLTDSFDASPVAVDRELFLRGHEFLYCIAEG
ncbi:MAG: PQQ-binding-like beta-propeller repeat protein [Opitutaceae bacterium]